MLHPRATRARAAAHSGTVSADALTVHTGEAGALAIVDVSGRVTVDSSSLLRPVLHGAIGAAATGVVIDLTNTTYLDTSGAATLIDAALLARDRKVSLRVIGLHGEPRLLAEVIELDRIFRALGSDVEFT